MGRKRKVKKTRTAWVLSDNNVNVNPGVVTNLRKLGWRQRILSQQPHVSNLCHIEERFEVYLLEYHSVKIAYFEEWEGWDIGKCYLFANWYAPSFFFFFQFCFALLFFSFFFQFLCIYQFRGYPASCFPLSYESWPLACWVNDVRAYSLALHSLLCRMARF